MNLAGKKILVTGADGFIGSHLTEELVRRGHQVRAFVLYNSFGSHGWLDQSTAEVRQALDVFAGDVRDPAGVQSAAKGCDVVLHLAALIAIPYSYHSPDTYVDTNIRGTLNVLQAARALNVQKLVHTSTSEVYGTAQVVPISEEHPLQAQSPYAATKIAADQLALSFHRSFGTPVTVARPFNTYGPRQSARAVIPTIITQLASGQRRLQLGALTPTRDFNFVADTVAGFIHAAESDDNVGQVINYGSGHEISIADTAGLIMRLMNVKAEITGDEQRLRPAASEVERLSCDNRRARALGWSPGYGGREGLERGLRETIDWFTQPANLQRYRPDRYDI